jgi:hypothetical protein
MIEVPEPAKLQLSFKELAWLALLCIGLIGGSLVVVTMLITRAWYGQL